MNPKGIKSFAYFLKSFGIMKNLSKFETLKIKNDCVMKKIMTIIVSALFLVPMACADDKAFEFNKLPAAAKEFILKYFPNDKVLLTTADDGVRPDYEVVMDSGVSVGFKHNGTVEKIEMRGSAVPDGIVPYEIVTYVSSKYPDAWIVEYEVDNKEYEVKLSNRIEMKFDTKFKLIGIDN